MNAQKKQLDELYVLAREIATKAHEGQLDKGGNPYIEHPIAVADSLERIEHKIIALLHDVLEDTALTKDDLKNDGFPDNIIESICVLTKKDSVSYEKYLFHIKSDPDACHVKIADIKHNMEIRRIAHPTENDHVRMEKYKKALAFLEETNLSGSPKTP
ncbi:MAG: HD domain-containing protein [Proteobacteria bacterium]|nr:HD domain-containing protein [Cystobacterineae bacterium]MCL2258839.1 HD domain-containing protein [Cystobacterineae bacterium]MCL2314779.1 HD domain-containing protein [Pseudomonadota bacterium]